MWFIFVVGSLFLFVPSFAHILQSIERLNHAHKKYEPAKKKQQFSHELHKCIILESNCNALLLYLCEPSALFSFVCILFSLASLQTELKMEIIYIIMCNDE